VRVPTVLFQITAIGKNRQTIAATVESVRYWVRHTPGVGFRYLVWIVLEPVGYAAAPDLYERLGREGVRVLVVPEEYRTPLGAVGKARALEYACAIRRSEGLSVPFLWVYHQDEETCVGADTLKGLSEFVRGGRYLVGAGVILYPLDWAGTPSHVQEVTRSYDDFRVLDSMTLPGNPTSGFHGSHIVVRADVEDSVGWDSSGYDPSEDLTFEIRVRARYGSVFGVLRGFAYEKGAFSLGDQLRQRRRWMHGVLHAVLRSPELPATRRLTVAYSALSWFAALPSIAILVASIAVHYGPLTTVTGVFTGFIWTSIVVSYLEGYRLHSQYLEHPVSLPKLFVNGLAGALVDVIAPWSALVRRPSLADFITKDRVPRPSSSRAPPAPEPTPTGVGA
jgi:beta-1,4-mannosyltransferase